MASPSTKKILDALGVTEEEFLSAPHPPEDEEAPLDPAEMVDPEVVLAPEDTAREPLGRISKGYAGTIPEEGNAELALLRGSVVDHYLTQGLTEAQAYERAHEETLSLQARGHTEDTEGVEDALLARRQPATTVGRAFTRAVDRVLPVDAEQGPEAWGKLAEEASQLTWGARAAEVGKALDGVPLSEEEARNAGVDIPLIQELKDTAVAQLGALGYGALSLGLAPTFGSLTGLAPGWGDIYDQAGDSLEAVQKYAESKDVQKAVSPDGLLGLAARGYINTPIADAVPYLVDAAVDFHDMATGEDTAGRLRSKTGGSLGDMLRGFTSMARRNDKFDPAAKALYEDGDLQYLDLLTSEDVPQHVPSIKVDLATLKGAAEAGGALHGRPEIADFQAGAAAGLSDEVLQTMADKLPLGLVRLVQPDAGPTILSVVKAYTARKKAQEATGAGEVDSAEKAFGAALLKKEVREDGSVFFVPSTGQKLLTLMNTMQPAVMEADIPLLPLNLLGGALKYVGVEGLGGALAEARVPTPAGRETMVASGVYDAYLAQLGLLGSKADRRRKGVDSNYIGRLVADMAMPEYQVFGVQEDLRAQGVKPGSTADSVAGVVDVAGDWLIPYEEVLLGPLGEVLSGAARAGTGWKISRQLGRTSKQSARVAAAAAIPRVFGNIPGATGAIDAVGAIDGALRIAVLDGVKSGETLFTVGKGEGKVEGSLSTEVQRSLKHLLEGAGVDAEQAFRAVNDMSAAHRARNTATVKVQMARGTPFEQALRATPEWKAVKKGMQDAGLSPQDVDAGMALNEQMAARAVADGDFKSHRDWFASQTVVAGGEPAPGAFLDSDVVPRAPGARAEGVHAFSDLLRSEAERKGSPLTVRETLHYAVVHGEDEVSTMAQRILAMDHPALEGARLDIDVGLGVGEHGVYDIGANHIGLARTAGPSTIVHEASHAITAHAVRNVDALSPAGQAAVRRLQEVFEKAQGSEAVRVMGEGLGLDSLDEFIAEAYSNPKFQAGLKSLQVAPGKSAWRAFVDAVAEFLGLRGKEVDALEHVLSQVDLVAAERGVGPGAEGGRLFSRSGEPRVLNNEFDFDPEDARQARAAFERLGRPPTLNEVITGRNVDEVLEHLREQNPELGPERADHVRRKVAPALAELGALEDEVARAFDDIWRGGTPSEAQWQVLATTRARAKAAHDALRVLLENESRKAKATPPFVSTRTGTDAVRARLSAAERFEGVRAADARDAQRMLEMLGHPLEGGAFKLKKTLNRADTVVGTYNFTDDVLSLAQRAFDSGMSARVLAHEIGHRVSAWLPKDKAATLLRQYVKERRVAMKANPGWFDANGKMIADDNAAYRWSSVDEWFAERFADHAHKRLGQWDASTRSVMDAARFLLEKVKARIVEFFGVDAVPGVVEDLMAGKVDRVVADARAPLRDRLIEVTDISGHGNAARPGPLYSRAAPARAAEYRGVDGKPRTATMFSGGGLVEAGLRKYIDPVFAVEANPEIGAAYKAAHGDHVRIDDVRNVDLGEAGDVDYLHASPVCKNFSAAKAVTESGEQPLDLETARATADAIRRTRPAVFTLENVRGYQGTEAMTLVEDALREGGYTFDANVYDAADYGAATRRKRLLLRAVKDGELPPAPAPTHGPGRARPYADWYSAVEDLVDGLPDDKVPPWMRRRLEAAGVNPDAPSKPTLVMGGSAGKNVPYAEAGGPAPTFKATPGEAHRIIFPDGRVKRVTPRAAARITGLPDDYPLPTKTATATTIIGNGVPPALSEAVFAPLLAGERVPGSEVLYSRAGAVGAAEEAAEPLPVFRSPAATEQRWHRIGDDHQYTELTLSPEGVLDPSLPSYAKRGRMSSGRGTGFASGMYAFADARQGTVPVLPARNPLTLRSWGLEVPNAAAEFQRDASSLLFLAERLRDLSPAKRAEAIDLLRARVSSSFEEVYDAEKRLASPEFGIGRSVFGGEPKFPSDLATALDPLLSRWRRVGVPAGLDGAGTVDALIDAAATWGKHQHVHPVNILLSRMGHDGIEWAGGALKEGNTGSHGFVKFPPIDNDGALVDVVVDPRHGYAVTHGGRDPRILYSRAPGNQTDTPAFRAFIEGTKVVDEAGAPKRLYHGTTHEFEAFDVGSGNVENHHGRGIYLTSASEDVGANYATREGPDLKSRIESQMESLLDVWDDPSVAQDFVERWLEAHPERAAEGERLVQVLDDGGNPDAKLVQEITRWVAEQEIAGSHGGAVLPVYAAIKNPVDLRPGKVTRFDIETEWSPDGEDFIGETGAGVEALDAIRRMADSSDTAERVIEALGDLSEGFDAADLERAVRDNSVEFLDDDSSPGQFLQDVYRELGFDGIVIDAYKTFGPRRGGWGGYLPGMEGLTPGTEHWVAFEPTQVKSATGNVGTWNPKDKRLLHSRAPDGSTRGSIELAPPTTREGKVRNPAYDKWVKARRALALSVAQKEAAEAAAWWATAVPVVPTDPAALKALLVEKIKAHDFGYDPFDPTVAPAARAEAERIRSLLGALPEAEARALFDAEAPAHPDGTSYWGEYRPTAPTGKAPATPATLGEARTWWDANGDGNAANAPHPSAELVEQKVALQALTAAAPASTTMGQVKDAARYIIRYFKTADTQTLLHENAHLIRFLLGDDWMEDLSRFFDHTIDAKTKAPRLTRVGEEQFATALARVLRGQLQPHGRLRAHLEDLRDALGDIWLNLRGKPLSLPPGFRDWWDAQLDPTKGLRTTVKISDTRIGRGPLEVGVTVDPATGHPVDVDGFLMEEKTKRANSLAEYWNVALTPGQKRHALGILGDDTTMEALDAVTKGLALIGTTQARRRPGFSGRLALIGTRSAVPEERKGAVLKRARAALEDAIGGPVKADLTFNEEQARGLAAHIDHLVDAGWREQLPEELLSPSRDLSTLTEEEWSAIANTTIDDLAGPGSYRDRVAEQVAGNAATSFVYAAVEAMSSVHQFKMMRDALTTRFDTTFEVSKNINPAAGAVVEQWRRKMSDAAAQVARLREHVRDNTFDERAESLIRKIAKQLFEDSRLAVPPDQVDNLLKLNTELNVGGELPTLESFLKARDDVRALFQDAPAHGSRQRAAEADALARLMRLTSSSDFKDPAVAASLGVIQTGLSRRLAAVRETGMRIEQRMSGRADLAENTGDPNVSAQVYKLWFTNDWKGVAELAAARGQTTDPGVGVSPGRGGSEHVVKSGPVFDPVAGALAVVTGLIGDSVLAGAAEDMMKLGLPIHTDNVNFGGRDFNTPLAPKDAGEVDGGFVPWVPRGSTAVDAATYRRRVREYMNAILKFEGVAQIQFDSKGTYLKRQYLLSQLKDGSVDVAAWSDAHRILDAWGIKSNTSEMVEMVLPTGEEIFIPEAIKTALDELFDSTAKAGLAWTQSSEGKPDQILGRFGRFVDGVAYPNNNLDYRGKGSLGDRVSRATRAVLALPSRTIAMARVGVTTGVIIPNPAFYIGNGFGGALQAMQSKGMVGTLRMMGRYLPVVGGDSGKVLREVFCRVWGESSGYFSQGGASFVATNGVVYSSDRVVKSIISEGLHTSQARAESAVRIIDDLRNHEGTFWTRVQRDRFLDGPVGTAESAVRTGVSTTARYWQGLLGNVSTAVDDLFRVATYVDELAGGAAPAEAAAIARRTSFDYGDLTDFEKTTLRRFIMFYTYQRRNADLFWWTMLNHPSRIMGQLRAVRDAQELVFGDDNTAEMIMPEHLDGRMVIDINAAVGDAEGLKGTLGVATVLPPLPAADHLALWVDIFHALNSSEPAAGREMLAKLAPEYQAFFVLGLNYDIFAGRDLAAFNTVPAWMVEMDRQLNGGVVVDDLFKVRKTQNRDPSRDEAPGQDRWEPTGDGAKWWWVFRNILQAPPFGRSTDTITQMARADWFVGGAVDGARWYRESQGLTGALRDDVADPFIRAVVRPGMDLLPRVNPSATPVYEAPSPKDKVIYPRAGFTKEQELAGALGIKHVLMPTRAASEDEDEVDRRRRIREAQKEEDRRDPYKQGR